MASYSGKNEKASAVAAASHVSAKPHLIFISGHGTALGRGGEACSCSPCHVWSWGPARAPGTQKKGLEAPEPQDQASLKHQAQGKGGVARVGGEAGMKTPKDEGHSFCSPLAFAPCGVTHWKLRKREDHPASRLPSLPLSSTLTLGTPLMSIGVCICCGRISSNLSPHDLL